METKICTKCKLQKQFDEFYKYKNGNTHSWCKICAKNVPLERTKQLYKERIARNKSRDILISEKICNTCRRTKSAGEFYKSSRTKDGLNNRCKLCNKNYHKEYNKKTNFRNNYRAKYPDKARAAINKWGKDNRDKINKYNRERRKVDIEYKIGRNLRTRLYAAIKNGYKSGSAIADLGCSIEKFKLWLEMYFKQGMNWENYGLHGWHIDHVKPLDSFNLTKREELLEAVNFKNLRPMWASDNLSKSNKINI